MNLKKEILESRMHKQHGLKSDALSFIHIAKYVLEIIRDEEKLDSPTITGIKVEGVIQILRHYEKEFSDEDDNK